MKKIHLYLCGGLGNQLFEYAAARNLAIQNKAKLFLDTKTGFYTDLRDSTKFSLKVNELKDIKLVNFNIFFLIYRIFQKVFKIKKNTFNFMNQKVIDESKLNFYDKNIKNITFEKNIYLVGYFQSKLYFEENENKILDEIWPQKPTNENYLKLKDEISKENSVCIGIRMHENIDKELGFKISKDRKKKMIEGIGGITPESFYLTSLEKIVEKIDKPEFFIFSSKDVNTKSLISNSKILKKYPVTLITGDKGFENAYDNLWLMSYCKNFIISNSTLYWWGAYFSKKKYNKNYVLCSSNFPNKNTCLVEWEKIKI